MRTACAFLCALTLFAHGKAHGQALRWGADIKSGAPYAYKSPEDPDKVIGFEAELVEAARVYERSVQTLGVQFLDAADQAVRTILAAPERWRVIEADVRRFLMSRFPYAIYYRVVTDEIRILAFKHHSRHPNYWHYRLSE